MSTTTSLFPWLTLVAIIWLQALSGTNTDFPAYSSTLKSRLSITQVQLNNLAVASDAGKLFGFLPGIAASYLPLPIVLSLGSVIGLLGYGLQYLFLAHKTLPLTYSHYLLLQVLAGNSVCWINTACYLAAMRKFPNHHGIVVGLATSYTGLSAKLYIALAQVMLGKQNATTNNAIYLLINGTVPLVLTLVTGVFLVESKPAVKGNGKGLLVAFVVAMVTGVYAVVETVVPAMSGGGGGVAAPTVLVVMVGLVVGVPLMKLGEVVRGREKVTVSLDMEVRGSEMEVVEEVKEVEVIKSKSDRGGVWVLVKSVEFWLYFLVYLCGGTMGLVYANNLGQVAGSRGVPGAVLLSVSSTFGFFGKLSAAPLSLFTRLATVTLSLNIFFMKP